MIYIFSHLLEPFSVLISLRQPLTGEEKLADSRKKRNCTYLLYEYRPVASGG